MSVRRRFATPAAQAVVLLAVVACGRAAATPGAVNPVPAPGHPPGPVAGAVCSSNYRATCTDLPCRNDPPNQVCEETTLTILGQKVTIKICHQVYTGAHSINFASNHNQAFRCVSGYPGSTCLSHFQECGTYTEYKRLNCSEPVSSWSGWQPHCYSPSPVVLPVPLPSPPPPRTTAHDAVVPDEDPSSGDPHVAVPQMPLPPPIPRGAGSGGAEPDGVVPPPDHPNAYTVIENPAAPTRDPISTAPSDGWPWPDYRTEPTGETDP
ncbi:MAG: hypothetical protein IT208_11620 [Chthonomonadales bacterium]|nr:hypothetical protein [Chthonomonadales bacterium]